MFKNSSEKNKIVWDKYLKKGQEPLFFSKIVEQNFDEFREKIEKNNYKFQEELIHFLLGGGVIHFKNALNENFIKKIIKSSFELSLKNTKDRTECNENTKNYFYIQSKDQSLNGGYKALDRSYYFFPWDDSSKDLFSEAFNYWRYLKVLAGESFNKYESNKPKDYIINRLHVIQYLTGGGTISPHTDPYDLSKLQIGCILSKFGEDYKDGGFTVFNENLDKVLLEDKFSQGSIFCFFPTLYHAVQPIDPKDNIDFNSKNGRWFLSMTTVGSDLLKKKRVKTRPINIKNWLF